MTLPGNIGAAVPDGPDWLVRTVRDLQQQLAQLRTARTLQSLIASAIQPTVVNLDEPVAADGGFYDVSQQVTVPSGANEALVFMTADLSGRRDTTTGGVNTLGVQVYAGPEGAASRSMTTQDFPDNEFGQVVQSMTAQITGLDGGTIPVGATCVVSSTGWKNDSLSEPTAHLSACVLFLRA